MPHRLSSPSRLRSIASPSFRKLGGACGASIRRSAAAVACLALLLFASACASPRTLDEEPDDWRRGYALFHDLLASDVDVDKILWVKFETDETERVIVDVAALCAQGLEEFRQLAAIRSGWELEILPLPAIELETRAEIESETASELLGNSGREFEIALLMTQLQTLRYAAALCRALAAHEPDPEVLAFLASFGERASEMRLRVLGVLTRAVEA